MGDWDYLYRDILSRTIDYMYIVHHLMVTDVIVKKILVHFTRRLDSSLEMSLLSSSECACDKNNKQNITKLGTCWRNISCITSIQ